MKTLNKVVIVKVIFIFSVTIQISFLRMSQVLSAYRLTFPRFFHLFAVLLNLTSILVMTFPSIINVDVHTSIVHEYLPWGLIGGVHYRQTRKRYATVKRILSFLQNKKYVFLGVLHFFSCGYLLLNDNRAIHQCHYNLWRITIGG